MKIGLLADIHGNCFALDAVLNSAMRLGVEKLLVAGDLVGYYFWPERVIELLEKWDVEIVSGNHEQMLRQARTDLVALQNAERRYGSGLRLALENLSPGQLDWLTSLPNSKSLALTDRTVLLAHGSPWKVDEYVYPDANDETIERFFELPCSFLILGHTHYPMALDRHGITILNPGSVGQPRNGVAGACWASLDTDGWAVTFHCEKYDHHLVVDEARRRHPSIPYLAEVFSRT